MNLDERLHRLVHRKGELVMFREDIDSELEAVTGEIRATRRLIEDARAEQARKNAIANAEPLPGVTEG